MLLEQRVDGAIDIYYSAMGAPNNPAAWSTASLSAPRSLVAVTSVGHTVFFAGGTNASGPSSDVDQLNMITGAWDSTASLAA